MTAGQDPGERLQKILARAGFGSRRACENLISEGRVTIDGTPARLGDRADPSRAHIALDGVRVRLPDTTVAYLLNKPLGVVTTASDPHGRPTVMDLVPNKPRVFPVGRLDRDTTGLLVLTNDGELAQRISHPSHGLIKTYTATVGGTMSDRTLKRLERGLELDDGPARAISVRILARGKGETLVELGLSVGRNRIVRRMLEAVGHPVGRLARTGIGDLRDPALAPGKWRRLTVQEISSLGKSAGSASDEANG